MSILRSILLTAPSPVWVIPQTSLRYATDDDTGAVFVSKIAANATVDGTIDSIAVFLDAIDAITVFEGITVVTRIVIPLGFSWCLLHHDFFMGTQTHDDDEDDNTTMT